MKLLVFDSHPVQYRAPVWQAIEFIRPLSIHVAYASDSSVKGHPDKDFGITVIWDQPMLTGYSYTILNAEKGEPLSRWGSLTGKGVKNIIEQINPTAILLTGFNYKYDWVALREARRRNIPVWLRCETQDEATNRSKLKSFLRSIACRRLYRKIDTFFYIGNLNRLHYINHRVNLSALIPAKYCTVDKLIGVTDLQKNHIRITARKNYDIKDSDIVIGFSGKLIPKKNPGILFDMLGDLPEDLRSKIILYFIGSGELKIGLQKQAATALTRFGVKTYFTGFINQSEIAYHYLAMDILILPSKRMGETWGLVANEAMQSGCSVIVSNAVGCSADFKDWERFGIFSEGSAKSLADLVVEFSTFERSFDWATLLLKEYSIEASAGSLIKALDTIQK